MENKESDCDFCLDLSSSVMEELTQSIFFCFSGLQRMKPTPIFSHVSLALYTPFSRLFRGMMASERLLDTYLRRTKILRKLSHQDTSWTRERGPSEKKGPNQMMEEDFGAS